ncbi:MAG: response regulator [Salibacteraceae bacterium]|nr:response regulator [Salibacteraceae bacterium]|tara:strand:+ start:72561 stop:72938 length:378 start_codon:yes stop_codon:yes gene_type:complete
MQKPSILLVDDNDIDILIAKKYLEMSDFFSAIHTAGDGEDALKIVKKVQPNYVLLDINMPILDGWGFLDLFEMPSNKKTIQPKIIMLTSSISEKDEERALNNPHVSHFLVKPINSVKIKQFLENH